MGAAEAPTVPDLPHEVARALMETVGDVRAAFADDLVSIVLFGSAAEGALRATSDVNLLIVLRKFERSRAERLREPLRLARATIRLQAMFLLESEIGAAVRSFSQKFSDIHRRHRVLFGSDPFANVEIPRSALIARIEQVLLNLMLRVRAGYIERGLREEQLAALVADAAGPLRTSAASVLELEGAGSIPPKEALRRLVDRIGGSGSAELLPQLSEAREQRLLPPGIAGEAALWIVDLAERMREHVKTLA